MLGLVARADDRGISSITWEFHRAMQPARTLVVREPNSERRGFAAHPERYPDAPVVFFDPERGTLNERACRDFLDGLDVCYLVETPYDFRFFEWARDAHCATVLHAMPEFWRWHDGEPRPDVWWLPTTWRAEQLPSECRVVEVPIPTAPHRVPPTDRAPSFLHVAGHRAHADRNGTIALLQAVRLMRERCVVRIITQDANLPRVRLRDAPVELQMVTGGVVDRWALYDDADMLVLPRRYGGLCLPALEAMACGLGLVMSAAQPQVSMWPGLFVTAPEGRTVEMPCGPVRLHDTSPAELARALDGLARSRADIARWQFRAKTCASALSWEQLRPTYEAEFERALNLVA